MKKSVSLSPGSLAPLQKLRTTLRIQFQNTGSRLGLALKRKKAPRRRMSAESAALLAYTWPRCLALFYAVLRASFFPPRRSSPSRPLNALFFLRAALGWGVLSRGARNSLRLNFFLVDHFSKSIIVL